MGRTGRTNKARFGAVVAALSLIATVFQGTAAAGPDPDERLTFKRTIQRDGKTWRMVVEAARWFGIEVSFSRDRRSRTASGHLAYDLVEKHTYEFDWDSTMGFNATTRKCGEKTQQWQCLKSGYLVAAEDHDKGSLEADIDFQATTRTQTGCVHRGRPVIQTRKVETSADSTFVFRTGHPIFGTIKRLPARAIARWTATYSTPCNHDPPPCPPSGQSVHGRLRNGREVFRWYGGLPDAKRIARISMRSRRVNGSTTMLDQALVGRVQRWRVNIAGDESEAAIRVNGLPKLSGKVVATPRANENRRDFYCTFWWGWDGDSDSYRYEAHNRSSDSPADINGTLRFEPRGGEAVSVIGAWVKRMVLVRDLKNDGTYRVDY